MSAQQAAAYYDPEKSSGAYPTRDAYLADLVDFTRREIAELGRLGCEHVQIDAPQYAGAARRDHPRGLPAARQRSRPHARRVHRARQRDHRRAIPGMTFGIHICRGNHKSMFYASGGYDRIAEHVFRPRAVRSLPARVRRRAIGHVRAAATRARRSDVVVLGLVSSKTPSMEIVGRLEGADRRGGERSSRSIDSRSARSAASPPTHEGNALSAAEQQRKLELVASVAHEVWS